MNDKCQRSGQCEAMDPSTYCTFNGYCRCKDGHKCRDLVSLDCSTDSDCGPKQYCSGSKKCQILKTLQSSCSKDIEECQENAFCSDETRICKCKYGFKESSRSDCIPQDTCEVNQDCKGGYCKQNKCQQGVSLGQRCSDRRQCQALDGNSVCDKAINNGTCTCALFYKKSFKGYCISDDRCIVDEDCGQKTRGKCFVNECVYPKFLGEKCQTSEECLLTTHYSVCMGKCKCLNPTSHQLQAFDNLCESKRFCKNSSHCLAHQSCGKNGYCLCDAGFEYFTDGICYKKRPQYRQDEALSVSSNHFALLPLMPSDLLVYSGMENGDIRYPQCIDFRSFNMFNYIYLSV